MQTWPGRSPQRPAVAQPIVRLIALLSAAMAVLGWAVGSPVSSARDLVDGVGDFQSLLVDATAVAAWLCLAWAAMVFVLEAAARLPGALGRAFDVVAAFAAPRAARRLTQTLLGLTVAAGPLMGGVALATPSASAPISLDRPAVVASTSTGASPLPAADADPPLTAAPAPPAATTGSAAPELDRPARHAFVASAPAPARARSDAGGADLITAGGRRSVADDGYVVRRGDTLWDVAARHLGPTASPADIAREWPQWYAANRAVIGTDPNLLRPGEVLHAPAG